MTYDEALNFIHSNFWQGSKPGLSRTRELLDKMGNPQDRLKFIHVAGTNGKGSFCAMLSSVLKESGLRVGCYTSPYILRFNERMKVNGHDISDSKLSELTEFIRPLTEEMEEKPTEFELITAIAMEFFVREKCDVVVLECGMGGRLDSTNIIKTPVLSVITGIALDHTAFLGDSIEQIAAEKAGIIKPKVPVLYCGNNENARKVILQKAKETNSPFFTVERDGLAVEKQDLNGTVFSWKEYKSLFLPLLGNYQTENAQNVLTALTLLSNKGFSVSTENIRKGLEKVTWPARFEKVLTDPLFLCDGGHNPQGIDSAVESVKTYFGTEKLLIITGVMADKNYPYMVSRLGEIADTVFCLTPTNPRALPGEDLARQFEKNGANAKSYPTVESAVNAALEKAKKEKKAIFSVGSLYMYGEVIAALNQSDP